MKWSKRMGIPDDVAEYTNRLIDARTLEDYPEDFSKWINKVEFPRPKGRLPFSLADLLVTFGTHDVRKMKREILPYFQRKGHDYVRAWYLHHVLDYLVKLKDWMQNTGESIEDCINKYRKNKAVTLFGTEEQLIEVMNFLKRNIRGLQEDLNLPGVGASGATELISD